MLYIVGFGCGSLEGMTIEAENAIKKSDLIVGYTVYTELMMNFFPDKNYYSTGMRQERDVYNMLLNRRKAGKLSP